VEKLQSENERLRRGGVTEEDRRLESAEKRVATEKKRGDRLEGELQVYRNVRSACSAH
jgi:hypothetical protein